ncbi:MAG: acetyl-CoA hydrolase, partial [Desulfatitalea sp.]|nr:acetyl-CoA hydrolase [Desulfatitalea sp.]
MDLNQACPEKVVDARTALAEIKNGSRIFIGTGCGEPQHLIRALVEDSVIQDAVIYQMLSFTLSDYVDDKDFLKRFALKLFFISTSMRKAAFEGKIDYLPAYLSQIPHMFSSQRIGLDVALIQVSPPDRFGYCSLGVSVDITKAGLDGARMVIAQVNSKMPRTWGDCIVHIDEIDYFVPYDEPLVTAIPMEKNTAIAARIGFYVNQLVDDGTTIQVGFGHLPNAILPALMGKSDLGVHTQLITDAFLPLFERNVITNKKKTLLPGRVVASLCMGSEKLYNYVNDNPRFYFRSSDFVNDPTVIA